MKRSSEREKMRARTRKITLCGVLTALGVAIMYLGSFIDVLDLTVAVIASMFCIVAVIEAGGAWPLGIYGGTAVLSLILLPNKSPAIVYLLFAGYYPLVKEKLEGRIKLKALLYALKLVIFNIAFAATAAALVFLLSMPVEGGILAVFTFVLGNVTFVLYDLALTRLITVYVRVLRPRLTFLNKK